MTGTAKPNSVSWRYGALCICLLICAVAEWRIYYRYQWATPNVALLCGAVAAALLLGRPQALTPLPRYDEVVGQAGWRTWLGIAGAAAGLLLVVSSAHLLTTQWQDGFFRGWLGGVTGDCLGATAALCETAALVAFLAAR